MFDDLFDRPIPRELAVEFARGLQKLAQGDDHPWADSPAWSAGKGAVRGTAAGALLGGIAGGPKGIARGAVAGAALGGGEGYVKGVGERHARRMAQLTSQGAHEPYVYKQASLADKLAAAANAVRAAALGEPTPEEIVLQEQEGLIQQHAAENEALRGELEQTQQMAAGHAEAAEGAQAQVQQAQEQLQQQQAQLQQVQMAADAATQQAAEAQMQASQYMQEAQTQASQAAAQADAKMRISIRVQQMRQQLAEMASQDPVAEEGESTDPIATATQQAAQAGMGGPGADPAAAAAAGQDPAATAAPGAAEGAAPAPAEGGGAAAAPKKKPSQDGDKKKSEDKKDDKGGGGGNKTEIKIGMAKLALKFAADADTRARVYSGAAHAIPGATLGAAAAHFTGDGTSNWKRKAVGAAIGAAVGGAHGTVRHERDQAVKDLGARRSLFREHAAREIRKAAAAIGASPNAGRRAAELLYGSLEDRIANAATKTYHRGHNVVPKMAPSKMPTLKDTANERTRNSTHARAADFENRRQRVAGKLQARAEKLKGMHRAEQEAREAAHPGTHPHINGSNRAKLDRMVDDFNKSQEAPIPNPMKPVNDAVHAANAATSKANEHAGKPTSKLMRAGYVAGGAAGVGALGYAGHKALGHQSPFHRKTDKQKAASFELDDAAIDKLYGLG